ncbi:MAG: FecR family protein [Spirochaetaceae bacterium]|nr:FecR family protein [Spirochaetaceae bacterium]
MKQILAAALFFLAAGIFAQSSRTAEAVIRDLAGVVEVKAPRAAAWTPAYKGQALTGDTVVSTGFKSTAVIAIGNSVLTVRPLTRLSLTELSRIQNSEKVELNLQTGRIRADVRPPQGGRTDFTVRSSAATASVRGTTFEFDTLNLSVNEGTVEFSGAFGAPVLVDSGRFSSAAADGIDGAGVSTPVEGRGLKPELPPGTKTALPESGIAPETENSIELSVTIHF